MTTLWQGIARFRATRDGPKTVTLAPGDIVLRNAQPVYGQTMPPRRTVRGAWKRVVCPTCGVAIGDRCIALWGRGEHTFHPHAPRIKAAQELS